jgi:pyridoxamine 5'-phosphate oxidase-like protein
MSTDELVALDLLNRVSYGLLATSMRAMPLVAPARHVVIKGDVLLRIHAGFGYHKACNGSVVAYGSDNFNSGDEKLWSVQCTGIATVTLPTSDELELLGPGPHYVDDEPLDPAYLRMVPQFVTVHRADYSTGV